MQVGEVGSADHTGWSAFTSVVTRERAVLDGCLALSESSPDQGRPNVKEALLGMALALALIVAGCGGGDDSGGGDASGYTRDDVASALELHNEHHEVIYEMAPGKDCVVIQVLTSSDEVKSAQNVAGDVPTALAVNASGDAGVIFAGFGTFSQDKCVAPAETDLNSLSE